MTESVTVKIDCGDCHACCQWGVMAPLLKPAKHLQYKPNGDCIYLHDTGCSLWGLKSRPTKCRLFDCRIFRDEQLKKLDKGGASAIVRIMIAATKLEAKEPL